MPFAFARRHVLAALSSLILIAAPVLAQDDAPVVAAASDTGAIGLPEGYGSKQQVADLSGVLMTLDGTPSDLPGEWGQPATSSAST